MFRNPSADPRRCSSRPLMASVGPFDVPGRSKNASTSTARWSASQLFRAREDFLAYGRSPTFDAARVLTRRNPGYGYARSMPSAPAKRRSRARLDGPPAHVDAQAPPRGSGTAPAANQPPRTPGSSPDPTSATAADQAPRHSPGYDADTPRTGRDDPVIGDAHARRTFERPRRTRLVRSPPFQDRAHPAMN